MYRHPLALTPAATRPVRASDGAATRLLRAIHAWLVTAGGRLVDLVNGTGPPGAEPTTAPAARNDDDACSWLRPLRDFPILIGVVVLVIVLSLATRSPAPA